MAYPLDTAAQNATLDAMFGDDRGATMPTSFEIALYDGHPLSGGTEVSGGGYVRPVVANNSTNFPAAADGLKTSAAIANTDPTGAWSDTVTHWLLIDAADSTTEYVPGLLTEELSIDGSETDIEIVLAIPWNTEGL